jgi:hypothetical protein
MVKGKVANLFFVQERLELLGEGHGSPPERVGDSLSE